MSTASPRSPDLIESDSIPIPGRALAVVFVVALLLRTGWGIVRINQDIAPFPDQATSVSTNVVSAERGLEFPDERQYWRMASSLWRGSGLRDEFGFQSTRMPLYPAMLAPFTALPQGVDWALALHWMCGAILAVLTACLGSAQFGPRVGMLAGGIVACDPFLVFFSSLILTEIPFLVVETALWWTAVCLMKPVPVGGQEGRRLLGTTEPCFPRMGIGLGTLGALCVYLRESGIGLVAVLFLLLATTGRHSAARRSAALAGLITLAALVPWGVRNHRILGEWRWLTTRGGISLYDGVGPQADGSSNLADVSRRSEVVGMSETEWDSYFRRESWRSIGEDPLRIAGLAVVKLRRLWNPLPNVVSYRRGIIQGISAIWSLPLFAFSLLGVIILFRSGSLNRSLGCLLILPAVYVTMVHAIFVGSLRYRLPAMPMMAILAALAVVRIGHRRRASTR